MSDPTAPATIVDQVPYPSLALDSRETDLWGKIDSWGDRIVGMLNPILIKEARQALKSRQFTMTFFLLLLASWLWSITGVLMQAPDIYFVPSGMEMLLGYYFVLAIPLMGIVPLAAHRSLASEIDDGTFEMLAITKLRASGIVLGKLNSAMLQMGVYFSAIVPCLAFSYLLRGVNLQTILMLIAVVFFTAMLLTTAGLLLATLATHRAGQFVAILALVGLILFAEFVCAIFAMEGILEYDYLSELEGVVLTAAFGAVGFSFMVLFLRGAMSRIAPVSENRSTALRWIMFFQQLLWIGVMFLCGFWYDDASVISVGIVFLGIYWLTMGTLMLGESPELSPRVQRQLPRTRFEKMLLTWFNPGPGTGFIFAVATGSVGAFAMGICGTLLIQGSGSESPPIILAMIIAGYLMMFLGTSRLLLLVYARRYGYSFSSAVAAMLGVLMVAILSPGAFWVATTGSFAMNYNIFEITNWGWTIGHAFNTSYDPFMAVVIVVIGAGVMLPNLMLMIREFRYGRIAVPLRVQAEESLTHPSPGVEEIDPLS